MGGFYHWQDDDLLLTVRVQPKASKDEISGEQDGALKIRITAPPVDGKANKHLIAYLASIFKVPKSKIELISGETGRNKRLLIHKPKIVPDMIRRQTPGTGSTNQNT